MIENVQRTGSGSGAAGGAASKERTGGSGSFGTMLRQQMENKPHSGAQAVNFSRHALQRAEQRGIELTPTLMDKLAGSVEKAQEKGATNILAFDSTQAFIINIPYGRVITTMSQEEMRENIFTNIDGAVLL